MVRQKESKRTRKKTPVRKIFSKRDLPNKRKPMVSIKLLIGLLVFVPLVLVIIGGYIFVRDLPSPQKLGTYDIPISTKIYDRNGILLYDIFADENRTLVPLSDIPKVLQEATIAIEDKEFYRHKGVNPIGGILRAIVATVTGHQLQGGSTITQQLVKSALLTPERSVSRKIREIILAYWVEILYPKDKILELYLNQVPYGGTAWGVESAAEKYFGKSVKNLDLAESSLLAGLPQAPTLYSPNGAHPELAKARQAEVLKRMIDDKYITREQAELAQKKPLVYVKPSNILAPHFVMYVKNELVKTYGERLVERGGLKVYTTLDLNLQKYAEATVSMEIDKLKTLRVGNGAALVTKPSTGEILAMVGSTDYFATPSGSFNVTTALRQPGSSIKPINYAIGIDRKIVTPASMFLDIPTCFSVKNQPLYCPKNYDGQFHGPVQLRFALGNSLNIPAVKMLYLNSVPDMIASASAFGLTTLTDPTKYGLSLTLGGGEVRMIDMASAFSAFANSGIRKPVIAIRKVVDKNGEILFEHKDPNIDKEIPSQLLITGERVISAETAFLISHILLDNIARTMAFGSNSELVIPGHAVSVKTGTTDDLRDNWTIGYTPQYLVAVWVGNNDNSKMNPSLVSGVTGAAPIWNKLMKKILEDKPDMWPKQPENIVGAQVCQTTGTSPNTDTGGNPSCQTRYEYFIKGTVPLPGNEYSKEAVLIKKDTGEQAGPNDKDNIEPQEKIIIRDKISSWCVDCAHPDANKPVIIK